MERILLAALDRDSYPKKLLEDNMSKLKDFKFDYLDNPKKMKLSSAIKEDIPSFGSQNFLFQW